MSQMNDVEMRLREMILGMELGPGEKVTERWAEARLSASRTPIRSALQRLEAEGLVCREGRGWMVTPIDLKEVEQLFVYRETLEIAAMRLISGRADAEALKSLTTTLDACGPDATLEETSRVGTEFHIRLARLCGNEFIVRALSDAMNRLARARWLENSPTHPGWAEHRAIVAALRQGKVDRAATLLETHIRKTRDSVLSALREGRRTFRARGIVVE